MKFLGAAFCCILFFCKELSAQIIEEKFAVGIALNINGSYRTLKSSYYYSQVVETFNGLEAPMFAYNLGVFGYYSLHPRVKLQVGISLARYGFRIKEGTPLGTGSFPREIITKFTFQNIPLMVKYIFFMRKIRFYVIGGGELDIHYLTRPDYYYWFTDGARQIMRLPISKDSYRKLNVSLVVGAGAEMNITKTLSLYLQPVFSHMMLPITKKGTPLTTKLFYTGVTGGIFYSFSRIRKMNS